VSPLAQHPFLGIHHPGEASTSERGGSFIIGHAALQAWARGKQPLNVAALADRQKRSKKQSAGIQLVHRVRPS